MDVKPALLSALEAEYEKNPFEVCQVDSESCIIILSCLWVTYVCFIL